MDHYQAEPSIFTYFINHSNANYWGILYKRAIQRCIGSLEQVQQIYFNFDDYWLVN